MKRCIPEVDGTEACRRASRRGLGVMAVRGRRGSGGGGLVLVVRRTAEIRQHCSRLPFPSWLPRHTGRDTGAHPPPRSTGVRRITWSPITSLNSVSEARLVAAQISLKRRVSWARAVKQFVSGRCCRIAGCLLGALPRQLRCYHFFFGGTLAMSAKTLSGPHSRRWHLGVRLFCRYQYVTGDCSAERRLSLFRQDK